MRIDDTIPEKIMKDLESARQKEKDDKQVMGIFVSFVLVMIVLALFYYYPEMVKPYAIAVYDFINHVIHSIQAKFNEVV